MLSDILLQRVQIHPDQKAYIFLQDGETESESLTYGELDRQARTIADHLQSWQGERALLLYPEGLEFITAFFGCLYAGIVAVPVYPPRRNQKLSRLLSIVNDAQAKVALTTTSILTNIDERWEEEPELARLKLVATDTIEANPQEFVLKSVTPESLAFLQYTSGSTGTPKGVMVTHGNIIHNQQLIQQAFGHSEQSVVAGWLPLFHDMGLIGNVLQPMYLGIPCILMPPVAFLQKPIRWLQVISKYRATTSGGPNFAYDLCVKKVQPEQLGELDLSSWDLAFSGAEPVRAETLEQFSKKFAQCGFNYNAFYPCYGMAESTLFTTGGDKNQKPVIQGVKTGELEQNLVVESEISSAESRMFVGCGRPYADTAVTIVNPESLTRCEKKQVGEIWLSGGSVSSGYWNRPQETKETFQAYLADTKEGPFIRTGDLGFLLDGELFVTGRLKDVIIIRGQNHYPQDIELTVQESHPALRPNCGAAFSVEVEGEERLVVVQEVERSYLRQINGDEVVEAIRKAVSQDHQLQIYGIVLLKTASIPKTSSGKIQRYACRQFFLEGGFQTVATWIADNVSSSSQLSVNIPSILEQNSSQNQQNVTSNTVNTDQAASVEISQIRADTLINWLREYNNDRINSRLIDEHRCIPPYIVLDFGNQGIMGMQVSEAYGGLGLRNIDLVRVMSQLAVIDLSLATFVSINNALGIRPIAKYATQTVKDELLPILAKGRQLASFAVTEPGAGSAVRSISAQAIPDGKGGWHLHGTKIWSGSSSWAGAINTFVQEYDAENQPLGMIGFVVRQGTSGLRPGPEAITMGMRGMVQNTMYFNGVPVTPKDLLGEPGKGMIAAQDTMMFARLGIAAMSIGAMKRCAQLIQRYASRREITTGILLDNPFTFACLSNLTAATTAAETFVNTVANFLDAGKLVPEEAFIVCKTSAPEFLWQAADWTLQLLGGRGYVETNTVPQIFRDARLFRIFEEPTETLNMHLGCSIMHESESLFTFLVEGLQASAIANRLRDVADQIKGRCLGVNAPFSKRSSAIRWAQILTGEIATYGFLLAAVEYQSANFSSPELHRAAEWTRLQFEQIIKKALVVSPAESVLLNAETLTEVISNYTQTIGDLEQTLAGEDHEINELLCKSPVDAHKGTKPLELDTQDLDSTKVVVDTRDLDNTKIDLLPQTTYPESELPTSESIKQWIVEWLAKELKLTSQAIDPSKSFAEYGLDSVVAVELAQDLGDWLGEKLDATIAWNFPTIECLAIHLASKSQPDLSPLLDQKTSESEMKNLSEDDIESSIAEGLQKLETLLMGK
ncbi:AMP-binding protein [Nostoc sp. 'Peltigera membranacea cyanobiont' 232]|uniref:AMP-binding protein n=1 Tax=Nostoc sp. 'Peltigera membranacea cyanobiont' 232 TaxID=2014531 RepID=UPI0016777BEA|nr:AMP-binding protein [Nostoc sp. 'Peltigera membranacea cyanobiont' 232]